MWGVAGTGAEGEIQLMSAEIESIGGLCHVTFIRLLRATGGSRKMIITPQEKECRPLLILQITH